MADLAHRWGIAIALYRLFDGGENLDLARGEAMLIGWAIGELCDGVFTHRSEGRGKRGEIQTSVRIRLAFVGGLGFTCLIEQVFERCTDQQKFKGARHERNLAAE